MTDATSPATTEDAMLSYESEIHANFRNVELVPFCIIIIIGFLANLTVILNGTRKGVRSKHYSNYFIINLAIADLGVVMMAIPINIVEYTSGLNVSQFTCAFIIPIRETFQAAALQSVAVLALARLKQVVSDSHVAFTKRHSLAIIVAIWLNSYLLISLPFGFVYELFPDGTCDPVWSSAVVQKVHLTLTSAMLCLPIIVATISYITIMKKLKNVRPTTKEGKSTTGKSRNLTILLTLLIITCWISSLPLAVYTLLLVYEVVDIPIVWWSVTTVLFYSSSAINPILVLMMKKNYRFLLPKLAARKRRIGNAKNDQEMIIHKPHVIVR